MLQSLTPNQSNVSYLPTESAKSFTMNVLEHVSRQLWHSLTLNEHTVCIAVVHLHIAVTGAQTV
jgi:hypothetical protein